MLERFFPQQQFAALLFDFDGTVADTMPPHFDAWNHALSHYGLTLSKEQHLSWAGRPTREIVELLSELHQVKMSYETISKVKEVHYLNSISNVKVITPVVEIIRAAHGKIPMAIVSGSRRKPVETTLQQLSLSGYFDVLVCAEDYTHGKPAPDCFLKAARLLNASPQDCLVFEDGVLGIQAAHQAGMHCLQVSEDSVHGHQLTVNRPLKPLF
jgi:beta-phosphoglucomutase family hydrolase